MNPILTNFFLTLGVIWVLLAGIGILKFKNFFYKVHVVGKGPSLGILMILIGLCFHFGDMTTVVKSLTIAIFVFITVPIGSSLLGLSEYERSGPESENLEKKPLKKIHR